MKKKKKRDKKIKELKHKKSLKGAYLKKYPNLFVHGKYANIELIREIEDICYKIDLRNLEEKISKMFQDHKCLIGNKFLTKYQQNTSNVCYENYKEDLYLSMVSEKYKDNTPYVELENTILLLIYNALKESGSWNKYMPIHHVLVRSYKGNFVILVNGFHQHKSSFGNGFYTTESKHIKISEGNESQKYRVALSMHALERIFSRTFRSSLDSDINKASYPLLLYRFSLLGDCEPIKINGEWATAIYTTYNNGPDTPDSLPHKIAYELLDRTEGFKILCGYCPLGFCKDDFVHCKTLLSPGMRGTPEEKLINSLEDFEEKNKFRKIIADPQFTEDHMELYKYFQNNGCHVIKYLE